jgi:hypothetical protein
MWYPPYMNVYLSVSFKNPAKLWGILNLKYLTSMEELNVSGFKFVKKFRNCTVCIPDYIQGYKAWGPYLYENEKFLPRAYVVENSVLVVGNEEPVTQTIYALMLNPNFNPANAVIIRGKQRIGDYDFGDLNSYSAVFLTQGAVDQSSAYQLQNYVESGGQLFPDLTKNKNMITNEDINNLFMSFKGGYQAIADNDIIRHNFDKREIKLDGQQGFLVYSEKFSVFDGWTAIDSNNKEHELLNADAMISSVYLEGDEGRMVFEYAPKSAVIGTAITLITALLLLSYFILRKVNLKWTQK